MTKVSGKAGSDEASAVRRPAAALGAFAALLAGCAALAGCAGQRASAARDLFAQAEKTVVTVRAVIKVTANGRDNENKVDITGTVIDPSGLTVVPASALLSPSRFM